MNLTDLCPEGIEKYAEWLALNNMAVKIDSLQVRQIIIRDEQEADRAYKQHIQECELCGGQDE